MTTLGVWVGVGDGVGDGVGATVGTGVGVAGVGVDGVLVGVVVAVGVVVLVGVVVAAGVVGELVGDGEALGVTTTSCFLAVPGVGEGLGLMSSVVSVDNFFSRVFASLVRLSGP